MKRGGHNPRRAAESEEMIIKNSNFVEYIIFAEKERILRGESSGLTYNIVIPYIGITFL
jgi:hypothetical protein